MDKVHKALKEFIENKQLHTEFNKVHPLTIINILEGLGCHFYWNGLQNYNVTSDFKISFTSKDNYKYIMEGSLFTTDRVIIYFKN